MSKKLRIKIFTIHKIEFYLSNSFPVGKRIIWDYSGRVRSGTRTWIDLKRHFGSLSGSDAKHVISMNRIFNQF